MSTSLTRAARPTLALLLTVLQIVSTQPCQMNDHSHTQPTAHSVISSAAQILEQRSGLGDGNGTGSMAEQQDQQSPCCLEYCINQHATPPSQQQNLSRTQPRGQSWIASAAQILVQRSGFGDGGGTGGTPLLQHDQQSPCCLEY